MRERCCTQNKGLFRNLLITEERWAKEAMRQQFNKRKYEGKGEKRHKTLETLKLSQLKILPTATQHQVKTELTWKQCDVLGQSEKLCGSTCIISVCTTCCARLDNYRAVFRAFKRSRRLWILFSCHAHTHHATHSDWGDPTMNSRKVEEW